MAPLKGPSKALKRRLAALQERRRRSDVPWCDPYEVAKALLDAIQHSPEAQARRAGRAFSYLSDEEAARRAGRQFSYWPRSHDQIMRQADAMHDRLMAQERERQAEKRRLKLERRAKRRAEAAREAAAPVPVAHGLPTESLPVPAPAAHVPVAEPVKPEPVPLASLRY